VRLVTYHGITDEDVDRAGEVIAAAAGAAPPA
jgi:hypothetical protein